MEVKYFLAACGAFVRGECIKVKYFLAACDGQPGTACWVDGHVAALVP